MDQRKISYSESTTHHICPVTGLPIYQRPEWTDIEIGPDYSITFKFIGDRILLSIPRGNTNRNNLDLIYKERAKVLEVMLGPDEPFFELKDFSQILREKDKSRYFLSFLNRKNIPLTDRVIGFIAYNVPREIKLAMNVQSGLHGHLDSRSIVDDYSTAVKGAVEALKRHEYVIKKGPYDIKPLSLPKGGTALEKSHTFDSTRKYVNDLITFIGSIRWDSCEFDDIRKIDRSHPFLPVYDAISLIKMEVDSLLRTKNITEKALRESEERYRGMFEHSTSFIYSTDLKGDFIDVNPAAELLTGYKKDELIGMSFRDFIHRNSKRKAIKAFLNIYKTEKSLKELDLEVIVKSGAKKYFETSASIAWQGKEKVGFHGSMRDITERVNDKQAMKKSEEKYRTILESIEDGYYEIDLHGKLVFYNDSLCAIFGYTRNEIVGTNVEQYIDKDRAKKVHQRFKKVLEKGSPIKGFDREITRKDGTKRYIDSTISLMKDNEGQPIGFRGMVSDITGRKRIEEERRELETQLQQAQKMEAIGTLAGGVAHDLNNILSGLVGYPELLLMDLPEDSPFIKPVLTIQKSGEKAAAIVQDLLTLARRGVAVTEVVNINYILSEYLKSPEYEKLRFYHPKMQVDVTFEPNPLDILGSTVHLSKTIMNLVSNAAEAMPDGGRISIYTENRYIDRPVKGYDAIEEGDYITLTVSDTGIGIPSNDIDRIFEPFYTKKVMGRSGTGLGMAVVWGTVKDHRGYIEVRSKEREGTTFTIYLPVTRKNKVKERIHLSIKEYMGKGESILIIDDVEEQRGIATSMLEKLSYSVTSVSSGEEAIEYMRDKSADLLVLDMIMDPGIDGLETYRRILELHPGQKAIIASGFSETDRVREAQKLGAGAYVKKPYLLEKIGTAVRIELDR